MTTEQMDWIDDHRPYGGECTGWNCPACAKSRRKPRGLDERDARHSTVDLGNVAPGPTKPNPFLHPADAWWRAAGAALEDAPFNRPGTVAEHFCENCHWLTLRDEDRLLTIQRLTAELRAAERRAAYLERHPARARWAFVGGLAMGIWLAGVAYWTL